MNEVFGNDYNVLIGVENVFGSGKTNATSIAWTEVVRQNLVVEFTPVVNTVDTNIKTGTAYGLPAEKAVTTTGGTVKVSGNMTYKLAAKLFGLALNQSGSGPFTIQADANATPKSAVIVKLLDTAPSGTTYQCDKAIGCKLTDATISGSSGGLVTVEANFTCTSYNLSTSTSITGTDPGFESAPVFINFGDTVAGMAFGNSATHINDFTIKITNNFVGDEIMYQNSRTMINPLIQSVEVELQYSVTYSAAGIEHDPFNNMYQTPGYCLNEGIIIGNTTDGKIEFSMTGQVTALTLPDPGKGVYVASFTERLVADNSTPAITITLTAGA